MAGFGAFMQYVPFMSHLIRQERGPCRVSDRAIPFNNVWGGTPVKIPWGDHPPWLEKKMWGPPPT